MKKARITSSLQPENDYLEMVRQDGLALAGIPREQRTARVCLAAVMQNAAAVKYVPTEFGVIPAQEQGKTTITINGKHFSGEFKVVEVETLTASHDPWTFSPNPAFPCQNDRDYFKDKNAQETVIKMSLAFDDRAFYNFPIVKQEYDKFFVVSGNNRVMSYMRASRYNDYRKYSETLAQAGDGHGFKKPIRVFLLDTQEAVTAKFLSFFNHSDKKEMSVIEKAVSISKILEAEGLRRLNEYIAGYETLGDFYASKDSISIFSYLTKETGLLNDLEVGKYFDKRTGVNSEGKTFLETLFIGSIFSADIIRTLNSEGMRTLLNKFIKASVIFASNKQLGKYNIIPYIEKAITVIKQAHLAGFSIEGFTAQQDFFLQRVADDLTLAIIEKLQGLQREFIGFFNMLGKRLLDAYHGESDLILGRPETPTEIIEGVFGIKLEPEVIPEPEVVSEPRRGNTRLIFDELIDRKERVSLLKETQDKTSNELEQTQNLETYKQERDEYETLLYNTLIFFHSDVESWIQRNPTPELVILYNKIVTDYETSDVDLMEFRQAYAALPTY